MPGEEASISIKSLETDFKGRLLLSLGLLPKMVLFQLGGKRELTGFVSHDESVLSFMQ